jgi:hypothetical protein
MCIVTRIDSPLPDLFTTSWSPSHRGLCHFKVTILTPLQWAHQTLSSFGLPTFPYSSCMCSPLNMWPCPIILLHLFWVYNLHMRENIWFLAFWAWLTLLKMMLSSSFTCEWQNFILHVWVKFHCLLVRDKESCTGSFFMIFPWIQVL